MNEIGKEFTSFPSIQPQEKRETRKTNFCSVLITFQWCTDIISVTF
jgi:hypothetical protein